MWLLLIGAFVALGLAAVWLGFIPPPHANTLIWIRNGSLQVTRGRLKPHAREHVTEVLSDSRTSSGFIAITANRVFFSRQIPRSAHQRLRNVLLNQWV